MRHVKVAYRLTNKSIIRVDHPNVDLEEDDTPVPEEAADKLMETDETAPKSPSPSTPATPPSSQT